jgi:hypothetical protein
VLMFQNRHRRAGRPCQPQWLVRWARPRMPARTGRSGGLDEADAADMTSMDGAGDGKGAGAGEAACLVAPEGVRSSSLRRQRYSDK